MSGAEAAASAAVAKKLKAEGSNAESPDKKAPRVGTEAEGTGAAEEEFLDVPTEQDSKDIALQQILKKMSTLDTMNSTIKELSENNKNQWDMLKDVMNKFDGVRKDLDTTRAEISELRLEIERIKKHKGKGQPNLVADPRIESLSEEVKKLKNATIGGSSTRAGSLPPASVTFSQQSTTDRFAATRPMTLVLTWGQKTYQRDAILEAANKVYGALKQPDIPKPQVKVNGNHAKCAYMTFDTIHSATSAYDLYIEIERDNKVRLGSDEDYSVVFLNWQRTPIQQEYGRRLNAVVQFMITAKSIDPAMFNRKVNQGLLLFQGDRMLRFAETLSGIEMRIDTKILAKAGVTKEQLDAAIQEDAARV